MIKAWTDEAWAGSTYWMKQDRKTLKRILQLLNDIDRNGYTGIGNRNRCAATWRLTGTGESMPATG